MVAYAALRHLPWLDARSTYTWSIRKSWTLILGQCPLLPIPCQPAGKFVSKFLGFKGIIEQFCNKESSWGSDLMNYAHSNFQSFPLSHHKVTRTRSHYYSVNSMPLSWDVSAFFFARLILQVSASWSFISKSFALRATVRQKIWQHLNFAFVFYYIRFRNIKVEKSCQNTLALLTIEDVNKWTQLCR